MRKAFHTTDPHSQCVGFPGLRVEDESLFNLKSQIPSPKSSSGFTLLEVILAIALSATLLALITSAISLFLTRTNDGRHRVEQAQLARNLFRLVGGDLRNVAVYNPQDTAIAQQLAASAGSFDVDLISGGEGSGTGSGTGGGTGGGGGSGSGGSGGANSGGSQTSSTSTQYQQPLGVYGTLTELQIDVLQPARPMPAPPSSSPLSQGDLVGPLWRGGIQTVRYYYRKGERPRGETIVTERFNTTARTAYGGLVREEIGRQQYDFAQQMGTANSSTNSGQVLAPEVVSVQFRYSDGLQSYDEWNSEIQQALPVAIEVRMWLENPPPLGETVTRSTSSLTDASQYVMTIPIWRANLANIAAATGGGSGANSGTNSGSGSAGGSSESSGGSNNNPSNF